MNEALRSYGLVLVLLVSFAHPQAVAGKIGVVDIDAPQRHECPTNNFSDFDMLIF